MATGTVSAVNIHKGYGFIRRPGHDRELFFHVRDLRGLEFGPQLQELPVQFDVTSTPQGPAAKNVRPAP